MPRPPCGRFAPSPTGPLHFGSLVAATGSYLSARSRGGRWLLRVDDIDPPREVPGAARALLADLERHGLAWDGPVHYQSRHGKAYEAALDALDRLDEIYRCSCTRREIAAAARSGPAGTVYPGWCRNGPRRADRATALRVRVDERPVIFEDGVYGTRRWDLAAGFGDFVVRRRDGWVAYALANVVDDAWMGVTEVVRGADLLDLTAPQIHLQRLLGHPRPRYLHLPVAVTGDGQKLSNKTGARPLPAADPRPTVVAALAHLGQSPPDGLRAEPLAAIWRWAERHWDAALIPAAPYRLPGADEARRGAGERG